MIGLRRQDRLRGSAADQTPTPAYRIVSINSQGKRQVGKTIGVRIPEIKHPIPVHADRIDPIIIPIACNRNVPRQAVSEDNVGKACRVAVFQIQGAIGWSEYTGGDSAVSVPVANDPDVARYTQLKSKIGRTWLVTVAQEKGPVPEDAYGGNDVSIPISNYRLVSWRAKRNDDIGKAIGIGV